MRRLGLAVPILIALTFPSFGQQPAKSHGCPPLNQYVHTPSENGEAQLVVMYRANDGTCSSGSYEFNFMAMSGRGGGSTGGSGAHAGRVNDKAMSGTWWWSAEGQFCWQQPNRPTPICKNNGHFIGQTPIGG